MAFKHSRSSIQSDLEDLEQSLNKLELHHKKIEAKEAIATRLGNKTQLMELRDFKSFLLSDMKCLQQALKNLELDLEKLQMKEAILIGNKTHLEPLYGNFISNSTRKKWIKKLKSYKETTKDSTCGVCDEKDEGDFVILLECSHLFCTSCLKNWFGPNSTTSTYSCPLCRAKITECVTVDKIDVIITTVVNDLELENLEYLEQKQKRIKLQREMEKAKGATILGPLCANVISNSTRQKWIGKLKSYKETTAASTCGVCNNKDQEDFVIQLECSHLFCTPCLKSLFGPNIDRRTTSTYGCPLCRAKITECVTVDKIDAVMSMLENGLELENFKYLMQSLKKLEPQRKKGKAKGATILGPLCANVISNSTKQKWIGKLKSYKETTAASTCGVCNNKDQEDFVIQLECSHLFCTPCLKSLFGPNIDRRTTSTYGCPLCGARITECVTVDKIDAVMTMLENGAGSSNN